jgi:alkanesulfonate monooxygenase SsuD/methylene tetrahydromethanopterin reductase-like flavin-dependent oxidoreductase (luciferase family)
VAQFGELTGPVLAACSDAGRDPATLTLSAAVTLCCGQDEAEFRRRAKAIGQDPAALRANAAAGTVSEVVDRLGELASSGAQRAYLQVLDLHDLDHLRLVAEEVAPALR